jgi:hypothetical protein
MNAILRSSAALVVFAVLGTSGCTGAYVTVQLLTDESAAASAPNGPGQSSPTSNPNYSCSATNCSLGAVASTPAYPPMMLAVAKTTTIISLTDDPVTDDLALAASDARTITGHHSSEEFPPN